MANNNTQSSIKLAMELGIQFTKADFKAINETPASSVLAMWLLTV